jgi:hypothetical protein
MSYAHGLTGQARGSAAYSSDCHLVKLDGLTI